VAPATERAELDEDVVARLERAHDGTPLPFVDERLGAAAIHRVIVNRHALVEELRKQLAPTALGIDVRRRLVRHRGIADEVDVDLGFCGRADDEGERDDTERGSHCR
jgi:hypothetical protein